MVWGDRDSHFPQRDVSSEVRQRTNEVVLDEGQVPIVGNADSQVEGGDFRVEGESVARWGSPASQSYETAARASRNVHGPHFSAQIVRSRRESLFPVADMTYGAAHVDGYEGEVGAAGLDFMGGAGVDSFGEQALRDAGAAFAEGPPSAGSRASHGQGLQEVSGGHLVSFSENMGITAPMRVDTHEHSWDLHASEDGVDSSGEFVPFGEYPALGTTQCPIGDGEASVAPAEVGEAPSGWPMYATTIDERDDDALVAQIGDDSVEDMADERDPIGSPTGPTGGRGASAIETFWQASEGETVATPSRAPLPLQAAQEEHDSQGNNDDSGSDSNSPVHQTPSVMTPGQRVFGSQVVIPAQPRWTEPALANVGQAHESTVDERSTPTGGNTPPPSAMGATTRTSNAGAPVHVGSEARSHGTETASARGTKRSRAVFEFPGLVSVVVPERQSSPQSMLDRFWENCSLSELQTDSCRDDSVEAVGATSPLGEGTLQTRIVVRSTANRPLKYRCGVCSAFGHNARTCVARAPAEQLNVALSNATGLPSSVREESTAEAARQTSQIRSSHSCSYCKIRGHNVRTCELRSEMERNVHSARRESAEEQEHQESVTFAAPSIESSDSEAQPAPFVASADCDGEDSTCTGLGMIGDDHRVSLREMLEYHQNASEPDEEDGHSTA